jgi:hypothetical protein
MYKLHFYSQERLYGTTMSMSVPELGSTLFFKSNEKEGLEGLDEPIFDKVWEVEEVLRVFSTGSAGQNIMVKILDTHDKGAWVPRLLIM